MQTRNFLITATVEGVSLGTFTTLSGGGVEVDGLKTRVGGMSDEIAMGGPASREDVTITKLFDTFMQTKLAWLESLVGIGTMSITRTPLGNNKQPSGPSRTFGGIVGAVNAPEADDNSGDRADIELVLSANQAAA